MSYPTNAKRQLMGLPPYIPTVEYSSVKVIVTTGDVEVVYDLPKVNNFDAGMDYEEGDIRVIKQKNICAWDPTEIAFTMFPNSNKDGVYMTITRTATAKKNDSPIIHYSKQIEAIKSIHNKMLYADRSGYGCSSCSENWPCRTITILDSE